MGGLGRSRTSVAIFQDPRSRSTQFDLRLSVCGGQVRCGAPGYRVGKPRLSPLRPDEEIKDGEMGQSSG